MPTKKETAPVKENKDEIIVRDIAELKPKELPLVVELPESASEAQKAFAKTINVYAYQNPDKWLAKKDSLLKRLNELKNAPSPVDGNLKINNSSI